MSKDDLAHGRYDKEEKLPTDFAILIADKFGIYPEVKTGDYTELMKRENDLRVFQQMAISCSFEDALLAYYDRTFNDDQIQALKLIYKATVPWLKGEVVSTLLAKIGNKKITNRDFAESIRVIVEQLETKTDENGNNQGSKTTNGLAFKLAKIKDATE